MCLANGILQSNENEQTMDTHSNTNVQQKQPETKEYIVYDFTYIHFHNQAKLTNGDRNQDDDYSVAGGGGLTKKGRREPPSRGLEMFYVLMWVVVASVVVA